MAADPTGLRAFVFGDCALDQWPSSTTDAEGEPWRSFVAARDAVANDATDEAIRIWHGIAMQSDLESRHTLQAWHFLRSVGIDAPENVAKVVLGAVAEVAVP